MTTPLRILGLGGSVRAESINKQLLELMLTVAREMGAETEIADIHSLNLPIFNQYLPREQQPEKLMWLIEQMKRADGFIICSPTYLGSLSGAVKNTLDSLHLAHGEPRVYFDGRPVALSSFGFYGQDNVVSSLGFVTRVMGAHVVPEHVTVSANEDNFSLDILTSQPVRNQIERAVSHLLAIAEETRQNPTGISFVNHRP